MDGRQKIQNTIKKKKSGVPYLFATATIRILKKKYIFQRTNCARGEMRKKKTKLKTK
jgi:hypothetical protein